MSGPVGSQQWMYSAGGFYPHEIDNSVRFNSPDSADLSRTPASAGNQKTWTWSAWLKRSELSNTSTYPYFFALYAASNTTFYMRFEVDKLAVFQENTGSTAFQLITSQEFRDPSAWYHIVVRFDTTQATSSNRIKIYVNGEQVTSFGTATYPAQNTDYLVNSTNTHYIGQRGNNASYYNGYLAEVNFIDGTALDPTDFGEFKSGVWIPKEYSGTYGTNGFYLDFGNSGSLGADVSGNGNNWTPTNLASTDQMLDSPTNNFPTFSPAALDPDRTFAPYLKEGNLRIEKAILGQESGSIGVPFAVSSGKWYFEAELSEYAGSSSLRCGFNSAENFNSGGTIRKEVSANGLYTIAIDMDNRLYWTGTNGTWDAGDPGAGTGGTSYASSVDSMVPFIRDNSGSVGNGGTWTLNFGQDSSFAGNKTRQGNTDANGLGDFYYAPPAGCLAICTANLPDPIINPAQDDIPADYFNPVLYTGNSSTQSITGVGFQPDWSWLKVRSAGYSHGLFDTVRGVTKKLSSNLTAAEATPSNFTSFDADGFTLGSEAGTNESGQTYVAWNWKAGGTAVSNTNGTIASQVSANTKAGFSIVSYTGDGNSTPSVGHGLALAPELMIFKNRDNATSSWAVYSSEIPSQYLTLNSTNGASNGQWITSSASTFGFTSPSSWTHSTGQKYIAYCFHSVEGFSKFGSYTGNASADGPFVYTGFRPAYVMVKKTDTVEQWHVQDTKRSPVNAGIETVYANLANAETSDVAQSVDYLSNGFKFRTSNSGYNGSGGNYIYMAFAEMPFKYANAR